MPVLPVQFVGNIQHWFSRDMGSLEEVRKFLVCLLVAEQLNRFLTWLYSGRALRKVRQQLPQLAKLPGFAERADYSVPDQREGEDRRANLADDRLDREFHGRHLKPRLR